MQKIRRVAILGGGAMGAFLASRFFDAGSFSMELIARGRYHDRLKSKGLVVNGEQYSLPVVHPDEPTSPVDLIMQSMT
jgi:2-dehydropantoate 2-reductase